MKFRPCIDIHDGAVKQIVGGSLDDNAGVAENYVAEKGGDYYANMYKQSGLKGGHIIILNKYGTAEYEASLFQAKAALAAYPGGMQIGGGVTAENAADFISYGASHVIVTSYVFRDGMLDMDRLKGLLDAVGREHIVLDLSCRKDNGRYFIVTDRWQKFTDVEVSPEKMRFLSDYCAEILVHGVDVEGKQQGIDIELLSILAACKDIKITYAGGIHSMADIEVIDTIGGGMIDFTVGSALDIFGGSLSYKELASEYC